jgi:hypothetical protein
MGPARRTAIPGDRRSSRLVAGRISARGQGAAARRAPMVASIPRHQGFPGQQSDSVSVARCRCGLPRAHAARSRRRRCRRASVLFFEDGSVLRDPDPRNVAERVRRSLSGRL